MAGLFIHDLALVLGVAALTAVIFRRLSQPSVLGYLAAGLFIGPYIPVPLFADVERVQALSELGVILVMFSVGLEFRLERLLRVLPTAGFAGLIQMATLLWIGVGIGQLLGWSTVEAIFLGASVAISSTMIVSKVYDEAKVQEDLRELVFGVLVLQDVAAIVLIAVMTAIATGSGVSGKAVVFVVGRLAAVLLVLVVAGLMVVPRFVRMVSKLGSPETRVVVATGVCFTFALIAEELGYSVALGAFIAGMLVAESGRAREVEHDIVPLRDVFGAVFFVSVGMTVDPRLVLDNLPAALLVVTGVVTGQLLSVSVGAILSGIPLRRALHAGLALGQIGEFAFIIAGIGVAAGVVRAELQPVLVTVAVITAFTTPVAVRRAPAIVAWVDHRVPPRLHRWLVLYAEWFERLRTNLPIAPPPGLRRALVAIALDGLGVVLVVSAWRLAGPWVQAWLSSHTGLSSDAARLSLAIAALFVTLPLFVGLVRGTRRVSRATARIVLGPSAGGPAGDVWGSALSLLTVLSVGVPAAALLRPVSSYPITLAIVLLGAAVALFALWRATAALDVEVRSSLEAMVQVVGHTARAVVAQPESARMPAPHPSSAELLPPHRVLDVPPKAPVVGQSLAALDLRVRTGATVLAIHRAGQPAVVPTGSETLRAGDRLVVVGTPEALGALEGMLAAG